MPVNLRVKRKLRSVTHLNINVILTKFSSPGCTESCHFHNFLCSQWRKFHQNYRRTQRMFCHPNQMENGKHQTSRIWLKGKRKKNHPNLNYNASPCFFSISAEIVFTPIWRTWRNQPAGPGDTEQNWYVWTQRSNSWMGVPRWSQWTKPIGQLIPRCTTWYQLTNQLCPLTPVWWSEGLPKATEVWELCSAWTTDSTYSAVTNYFRCS